MEYSSRERFWLWTLAGVGVIGVNGAFLWAVGRNPAAIAETLANPIAAAFIAEALLLVGVLAYLLARWRVTTLHWAWFVVLALVGSLAFALPVALLWSRPRLADSGSSRSSS